MAGQGHAKLRAAGIAVDVGLCAAEAAHDHAGHFRRIRDRRPHVILKLAVSADDKIGAAGRRPFAITGEAARTRVHMLRAQSDAILVGDRHGAGGRSAADLPPAGHGGALAGAGGAGPRTCACRGGQLAGAFGAADAAMGDGFGDRARRRRR